jgi:CDP-diacylglycerol--glycerol-3-phosphate 3-phosphatidyltransferase
MPETAPQSLAARANIPNVLTGLRVVLAVAFFAVLTPWKYSDSPVWRGQAIDPWLILAAVLFSVAAGTDFLDGHLARRWKVVSVFGRIMDPFADKLLVIGAFVFLAGPGFWLAGAENGPAGHLGSAAGRQVSGVYPWMVAVILGRELLVTSIRAAVESRGISFAATWSGKLKMVLQSVAVPAILIILAFGGDDGAGAACIAGLVWAIVIVTAWSGVPYITRAGAALRQSAPGATEPAAKEYP